MASVSGPTGFLGLGIMGTAMARNLLKAGFEVVVWNRNPEKCKELVAEGARAAASPAEVMAQCVVTYAMLADPAAAQSVVFGPGGVLEGAGQGRAYCDMSTVDEATSRQICEAVTAKGARFLEAPVSGSKVPAINGQLIILAAGDQTLFDDALPALSKMGKKSFFLGAVGAGARMKLVVNMVMGSMMGSLCEGMSLAVGAGLPQAALLEVLGLGAMACPMFAQKGPTIEARKYPTAFPLKHQQKDLRLALELGEQLGHPLPVAAAANSAYVAAMDDGRGDDDFAAVYEAVRDRCCVSVVPWHAKK